MNRSHRRIYRFGHRIEVSGLDNISSLQSSRLVFVCNHRALIDPLILAAALPLRVAMVVAHMPASPSFSPLITAQYQQAKIIKPLSRHAEVLTYHPASDGEADRLAAKLAKMLEADQPVAIFPEQLPAAHSVVGAVSPMALQVAQQAGATIVPVHIDGTQCHASAPSRLHQWRAISPLRVTFGAGVASSELITTTPGDEQSAAELKTITSDLLIAAQFNASRHDVTLTQMLLHSCKRYGKKTPLVQDHQSPQQTFGDVLTKSLVLGALLAEHTAQRENVGIMMPSVTATMVVCHALSAHNRVIALLNFTAGARAVLSACDTANIKTILTSRTLIEQAGLQDLVDSLSSSGRSVICLEDMRHRLKLRHKIKGLCEAIMPFIWRERRRATSANQPAVMLFTSGSESAPKGVVLSHQNIVANCHQILARLTINPRSDVLYGLLPVFHSFGFLAGLCLPVVGGFRIALYPSPLKIKEVINFALRLQPTLTFASDSLLRAYGDAANPHDLSSLRAVYAGAERLSEQTRTLWMNKFSVPVYQGYGVTETSPVVSVNTTTEHKPETIGRLMPGIDAKITPVEGIEPGSGELAVRGKNIMLGYLNNDGNGAITPPPHGWHYTGDIARIDPQGYISIVGRLKRFAKIGGEMLSLTAIETWVQEKWQHGRSAAVCYRHESGQRGSDDAAGAVADAGAGVGTDGGAEKIMLITECSDISREALVSHARSLGIPPLHVPRRVKHVEQIPLLSTGKINYPALSE